MAQVLEATPTSPEPPTTRQVEIDSPSCSGAAGSPYCTIQAAVDAARDEVTILSAAGSYIENVELLKYDVYGNNQTLTIQGAGAANTFVDGNRSSRLFIVWLGGDITLAGLAISTFTGNTAALDGGGLWTDGELTVANSTFIGNSDDVFGGGQYAQESDMVTIGNSAFHGNTAVDDGGGLYVSSGDFRFINKVVADNHADLGGGGMWVQTPPVYCTIQ